MGLYDCRCIITGVSLKGSDAALVPLQGLGGVWSPIACAIKGTYNRLGCIDGVEEDANAQAILVFFLHKLVSREFVVDVPYLRSHDYYPIRHVEHLLAAFERNINDNPEAAVLYGQPVVFALICRAVWDEIAQASMPSASSASAMALPVNIYGDNLAPVAAHMHELWAVHDFLLRRKLSWQPADNPEQHYAREMMEFLVAAKRMFSDSPSVLNGLSQYEQAIADLLPAE
jgi:hypothetical protein